MDKTVLILGANSDVAKECIRQYVKKGFSVIAASRNTDALKDFVKENALELKVSILYFDAVDFDSHRKFYDELYVKTPHCSVCCRIFGRQREGLARFQRSPANDAGQLYGRCFHSEYHCYG